MGMQAMVIEYARDVLHYADANSVEFDPETKHNVVDMMEDQKALINKGGSMRLGAYPCALKKGTKVYDIYSSACKISNLIEQTETSLVIRERHRHRYEFNHQYKEEFERAGMICSGINPETGLVEIVEVPSLRWYIGTQFHPEYSSTVLHPHPLFVSFVRACMKG